MAFRGFLLIPRILTELRSEKFEWFGPSPIEPFNLGLGLRPAPRRLGLLLRRRAPELVLPRREGRPGLNGRNPGAVRV